MTGLFPDLQNHVRIQHRYGAGWTSKCFVQSEDMEPFGPKVLQLDPMADQPLDIGSPKRVRYCPVPKQKGKETFPEVRIELAIVEKDRLQSVAVPAWEGAEVEVEVRNVWDPSQMKTVKLKGTLKKLFCSVTVDADAVKSWLDPKNGPFGARINENLFEFRFKIPAIKHQVSGEAFAGESSNRIFFYRRRILVFLPGVFGSQVQVKAPSGEIYGFPDFFIEAKNSWLSDPNLGMEVAATRIHNAQQIGVLECDDAGRPLAEPENPKLFMMNLFGSRQVYDPFTQLIAAKRRHHAPLAKGFRLYRLFLAPYDWRLDLTDSAKTKLDELEKIQAGEFCRKAPDADDELVVIGHSTGGLLIRGMMTQTERAKKVIGKAFFVDVPFRGAPKPLSVIATGRDPLNGGSMIPFVDPFSLRSIVLTAPIVYHLSASPTYPEPVFVKHDGKRTELTGLDGEAAWVRLAIDKGFMPGRKVVPAKAPLTSDQRKEVAMAADAWAAFWQERWERQKGRVAAEWLRPGLRPDSWEATELVTRKLVAQNGLRVEQDWNEKLARAAADFHKSCEDMAARGDFADRSFIFCSVAEAATTLRMEAERVHLSRHRTPQDLLRETEYAPLLERGVETYVESMDPPMREVSPNHHPETEPVEEGVWEVDSWRKAGQFYELERWRFATRRQIAGDGTVPLVSQVGFGGKASVFKRLVFEGKKVGPQHVPSPDHPWVWDRIVDVLQGHDVGEHLATSEADPVKGTYDDDILKGLRHEYWMKHGGS